MKKKRVFGKEVQIWLYGILLGAVLTAMVTVFWAAGKRFITFGMMITIFLVIGAITGNLFWLIKKNLLDPYSKCENLFLHFVKDGSYQELLDSQYEIFQGQQDVIKKLDAMLDKKNIIQLSTKHAELLALQNQINPHFLYNTLDAIRGDALCEGVESIADTTEALSTFFRYTITDTGNLVTLEDELENIENYFKIQQYRFGEKLKMQTVFPEDFSRVSQCKLPKLTLQPAVENAIFHGLEAKAKGGTITITINTTETQLLISIHDDGMGMPEDKLKEINSRLRNPMEIPRDENKKGGIALMNVSKRIRLLFGEEYGIRVYSIPDLGTETKITIPIIIGS